MCSAIKRVSASTTRSFLPASTSVGVVMARSCSPLKDVVQSFQGPIKSQEKALQMDIRPLLSFHGDEKAIRQLVSIWYNGNETKFPVPSKGALQYRVNPVCALCEANRPDIQVSGLFCITPFRTRECLPCAALQHLSALCGGNNVSRGGTALLDFAGCVRPRQGVPALLLNLTRSAGTCFFGGLGHLFFPVIPSFFHLFFGGVRGPEIA